MYIDEPGISTPGITIETAGASKTDGSELTNVHVINAIAPKATTIPTFMYHLQNVGEKLEILRNNRNDADYKLYFNEKKVEDSKNKSKEILDFFNKEF